MHTRNEIVLDTETTGFDDEAEVIQVGIMDLDGNELMNTLVQCEGEIPDEAYQVHGISKAMLENAPTWPEIHQQICDIICREGQLTLMYNSSFDSRLITQTMARHDLEMTGSWPTKCVMKAYANEYMEGNAVKLGEAAHYEFAGTCCSTFGDMGYLFKPVEA